MSRVDALMKELGYVVEPSSAITCSNTTEFIKHLATVYTTFKNLNTCLMGLTTVATLTLLYASPPELALVMFKGRVCEVFVGSYRYVLELDYISDIVGPRISRFPALKEPRGGCYVPISCRYYVTTRRLDAKPVRVLNLGRTYYLYVVEVNPVPYNVLELLNLLK